jgi:DNA processing protein
MHSSFPDALRDSGGPPPVREIGRDSEEYPARLLDLADPPTVLYVRGSTMTAAPPAVAIVGTRRASAYGLRVARAIAVACARAGACVVSGLATGIDAAGHEGALAVDGRTVAVLGTGIDMVYPRSHFRLQEDVARHGLVMSELPPGSTGHRGSFPKRNRLIAALADVTVVVEAGEGSGALITSTCALELGRTVACVPNAIDLPSSVGSNALLKQGAEPVLAPADVVALLNLDLAPSAAPVLDGDAATCWDVVQRGARTVRQIVVMSGLSHRAATVAVSSLELEGLLLIEPSGGVRPTVGAGAG